MTRTFIFAAPTAQLNSALFFFFFLKVQRKPEHSASIQFLQLPKQSLTLRSSGSMAELPPTWRRRDWACTELTLLQRCRPCIAISRTWLAAFSSCAHNSSPRLLGNLLMVQSSLNSNKLFQTSRSESALLIVMSLPHFLDYPDEFTLLGASPTAPN